MFSSPPESCKMWATSASCAIIGCGKGRRGRWRAALSLICDRIPRHVAALLLPACWVAYVFGRGFFALSGQGLLPELFPMEVSACWVLLTVWVSPWWAHPICWIPSLCWWEGGSCWGWMLTLCGAAGHIPWHADGKQTTGSIAASCTPGAALSYSASQHACV